MKAKVMLLTDYVFTQTDVLLYIHISPKNLKL